VLTTIELVFIDTSNVVGNVLDVVLMIVVVIIVIVIVIVTVMIMIVVITTLSSSESNDDSTCFLVGSWPPVVTFNDGSENKFISSTLAY
jgi:flagellar basal body-associated protein FliL